MSRLIASKACTENFSGLVAWLANPEMGPACLQCADGLACLEFRRRRMSHLLHKATHGHPCSNSVPWDSFGWGGSPIVCYGGFIYCRAEMQL